MSKAANVVNRVRWAGLAATHVAGESSLQRMQKVPGPLTSVNSKPSDALPLLPPEALASSNDDSDSTVANSKTIKTIRAELDQVKSTVGSNTAHTRLVARRDAGYGEESNSCS